jgi:hypothetical protein
VIATLLPRVIALRQDLLRRCEQWGIPFRRRRPGSVACGAATAIRGRLQNQLSANTRKGASPADCSTVVIAARSSASPPPPPLSRIGVEGTVELYHVRGLGGQLGQPNLCYEIRQLPTSPPRQHAGAQ